jgi:hypothetical protein
MVQKEEARLGVVLSKWELFEKWNIVDSFIEECASW